jgi:hypothetical protein
MDEGYKLNSAIETINAQAAELDYLRAARGVPVIAYWTFGLGAITGWIASAATVWALSGP